MITTATEEKVEAILRRPYARELVKEGDGTWFARIVEFKGCMTVGDTEAEALDNLEDAMLAWVTVVVEDGESIPEPIKDDAYSDKFMVRVTKSLHRDLVRRAEIEGVSLNHLVNTELARAVR